jgi:hypothetical protein
MSSKPLFMNDRKSPFQEYQESWILMDIRQIWMIGGLYPVNDAPEHLFSDFEAEMNDLVYDYHFVCHSELGTAYNHAERNIWHHLKEYYPSVDLKMLRVQTLPPDPVAFVKYLQAHNNMDITLNPGIKSMISQVDLAGTKVKWGFYFVRTK